jgi:hypothetical protein
LIAKPSAFRGTLLNSLKNFSKLLQNKCSSAIMGDRKSGGRVAKIDYFLPCEVEKRDGGQINAESGRDGQRH